MAPTIHRERGYRLFFFSREEFRLSGRQLREIEAIVRKRKDELEAAGTTTLGVEVTNISRHGIWILCRDQEMFLSFEDFPWFRDAPVAQILNVDEPSPNHYRWPDLDIDLGRKTIEHPEQYPMLAQGGSA